jgi:hypothetical protein
VLDAIGRLDLDSNEQAVDVRDEIDVWAMPEWQKALAPWPTSHTIAESSPMSPCSLGGTLAPSMTRTYVRSRTDSYSSFLIRPTSVPDSGSTSDV